MTYVGRRTLYVWGLLVLSCLVFIVGFLSLAPNARNSENPNVPISWASGSMILIFTGIYNFTVGPVCYSLVAEMPSTRLRQKTVVLARNLYNVCGVMLGVLIPYMLNPTAWNLMGASGKSTYILVFIIPWLTCIQALCGERLACCALSGRSSVFPSPRVVHTQNSMCCSRSESLLESSRRLMSTCTLSISTRLLLSLRL